ncbi:hypothetical protein RHECNPAF_1260064 [Rhizobium etli CNPAF512]|nr:hypothetical protein RHECNPAF_1260064 [Rhizobium etli CNPAF512]
MRRLVFERGENRSQSCHRACCTSLERRAPREARLRVSCFRSARWPRLNDQPLASMMFVQALWASAIACAAFFVPARASASSSVSAFSSFGA